MHQVVPLRVEVGRVGKLAVDSRHHLVRGGDVGLEPVQVVPEGVLGPERGEVVVDLHPPREELLHFHRWQVVESNHLDDAPLQRRQFVGSESDAALEAAELGAFVGKIAEGLYALKQGWKHE